MRRAFIKTLTELAREDNNVYLLTGDLGFSVFEDFSRDFPNQYLNCGVAEQNMIGTAAGLALSGKKVFVYSIIPFATMRPFEQIRNDICLHNLDVKIVGVGGGYSYGQLGATHHSIEDVAIMRALPNMKILVPADPMEVELAVMALVEDAGPAYIRLGKSKEENLHKNTFKFEIGKSSILREGHDAVIIGAGPILKNVMQAAEILSHKNISCKVISMSTIKPIDGEAIVESLETGRIITVEEHSTIGGLGDSVAAVLAERGASGGFSFKKIGIEDKFMKIVGDQEYLRNQTDLSPEKLQDKILRFLSRAE